MALQLPERARELFQLHLAGEQLLPRLKENPDDVELRNSPILRQHIGASQADLDAMNAPELFRRVNERYHQHRQELSETLDATVAGKRESVYEHIEANTYLKFKEEDKLNFYSTLLAKGLGISEKLPKEAREGIQTWQTYMLIAKAVDDHDEHAAEQIIKQMGIDPKKLPLGGLHALKAKLELEGDQLHKKVLEIGDKIYRQARQDGEQRLEIALILYSMYKPKY